MRKFIAPIIVVAFGLLWLMNELEIIPPTRLLWTLGLGAGGVAIFAGRGFHKESFVPGAMLLFACLCSILRWFAGLRISVEVPLLIVALGICLGLNQTDYIPAARKDGEPKA